MENLIDHTNLAPENQELIARLDPQVLAYLESMNFSRSSINQAIELTNSIDANVLLQFLQSHNPQSGSGIVYDYSQAGASDEKYIVTASDTLDDSTIVHNFNCIREGCFGVVRKPVSNSNMCECSTCLTKICLNCGKEWHIGTCANIDKTYIEQPKKGCEIQICLYCGKEAWKDPRVSNLYQCKSCNQFWCWLCNRRATGYHYLCMNPCGCPGLESGTHLKKDWGACKLFLWRILVLFLCLLIFPIWIIYLVYQCDKFQRNQGCCWDLFCCLITCGIKFIIEIILR